MRQTLRSHLIFAMAAILAFTALGVGVASARTANTPAAPAQATNPIVGRWQQTHKCSWLVQALKERHLGRIAPGVVGDYFPNKTPRQLARKRHLCRGAEPQRHSHFFTSDGNFGSLDQHGQQVDDNRYRVIDTRTIKIGDRKFGAKFHYQITDYGADLALSPVITKQMRRQALAHPLHFSAAGWSVAVAYPGHSWASVPCGTWC
jgi:hypothetical protein